MKIKKIDEDVHIYDNQDTFDYIKGTITNVNELIDALNELEEKVNKLENEKEELKSELSWINYHQLGLDKKQSAPEHEDKAFLPLLKYNAAKFFNIDKYTNKTSKGYECKLCTDPVFISIDEMPMYQHLNDAHPFGKSDSKDCICGIVTDNAHRYDCPFFKEIDSQPTDDSDKIELKVYTKNLDDDTAYISVNDNNFNKEQAEAVKARIEKALEFYNKYKDADMSDDYNRGYIKGLAAGFYQGKEHKDQPQEESQPSESTVRDILEKHNVWTRDLELDLLLYLEKWGKEAQRQACPLSKEELKEILRWGEAGEQSYFWSHYDRELQMKLEDMLKMGDGGKKE